MAGLTQLWVKAQSTELGMPVITAVFDLTLSSHVRVQFASSSVSFQFKMKEYSVSVDMSKDENSPSIQENQIPIYLAQHFRLSVSKEEGPIPDIKDLIHGRDVKERGEWFGPRYDAFRAAAIEAANRVVHFFKYALRTPRMRYFNGNEVPFYEPTWLDDTGTKLDPGMMSFGSLMITPDGPHLLGQKALNDAEVQAMATSLEAHREVSTARDFLADAQTSIVEGNLRRGVMEMAISCEVAIKQAFFWDKTHAGAAYEYLESNKKITDIATIDFLHGPALAAFSESFKNAHQNEYRHLEFLFRARNKIAHRGTAYYSDGKKDKDVDRVTLEQWWSSVEKLFEWLKQRTGREV